MSDEQQLTQAQAIAFATARMWEVLTPHQRASFQLTQRYLCMPFSVFHRALEEALGRPVWTHEIGMDRDGLLAELNGERDALTFEQVIDMIADGRRILVETGRGHEGGT